jgi:ATP-dependent Clp protease ATP-binding subunit ClpA
MGVDVDALARDVSRALDVACREFRRVNGPLRLQTLPSGEQGIVVDFRAPLTSLLNTAEKESTGLAHNWVGTEHLLLAVIQLADPPLREVLKRHRVKYDGVRQSVLEALQS